MSNINDTVEYLMGCRKDYVSICSLDERRIIFEMKMGRTFISYKLDKFLEKYNLPADLTEKLRILKEFKEKELIKK